MNEQNTNNKKFHLQFKHKDFICKHIAIFRPHRQIARDLLKEFPDLPLTLEEALTRVRYYSSNNVTLKWRRRIDEYRRMQEFDFANRYRLANRHQRMIELQRIFEDAMKPKVRRVVWFPVSRSPKGDITYGHKLIRERDRAAAMQALQQIARLLDDLALSPYHHPFRDKPPTPPEEIFKMGCRDLKNLDMLFGLK